MSDWDDDDWDGVDFAALVEEYLDGSTIQKILDEHPGLRVGDLIRALRKSHLPPPEGWDEWGFSMEQWRDQYACDEDLFEFHINTHSWFCDGVEVFEGFGGTSIPIFNAAYTSVASNMWDLAATWGGGGFPVATDTAVILNGHVVKQRRLNEACLSIDVQSGGEFEMDTASAVNACTMTFDDAVGAGFRASAGQFTGIGTTTRHCKITSVSPPPTNYWDFQTDLDITADYTDFEYMIKNRIGAGCTIDCGDCTWAYNETEQALQIIVGVTITRLADCTIDNAAGSRAFVIAVSTNVITGLAITNNTTAVDILASNCHLELTDSSFDAEKVDLNTTGWVTSAGFNGRAADFALVVAASDTVLLSEFATAPGTGDNLLIYDEYNAAGYGYFRLNQNVQLLSCAVGTNIELQMNAVTDGAARTLTYDAAANSGFATSTGRLNWTGSATFGSAITSSVTPPTVYWDFSQDFDSVSATYATFSYFGGGVNGFDCQTGGCSIQDTTFEHSDASTYMVDIAAATITRFQDVTIDDNTAAVSCLAAGTYAGYDNIAITNNSGTYDIDAPNTQAQFVDSNFDASAVVCGATGWVYSRTHGDTADAYEVVMAYGDTVLTNEFTSVWGTGDTVTIRPEAGTPGADATLRQMTQDQRAKAYDIQARSVYKIDPTTSAQNMTLKWDDVAGCGLGASAGGLSSTGSGTWSSTVTSFAASPTNYWDFNTTLDIIADYTTFSLYETGIFTGEWDVDNCTFTNNEDAVGNYGIYFTSTNIVSFTNTNLTNLEKTALRSDIDIDSMDNIVITGSTLDVWAHDCLLEFEASNWSRSLTDCSTSGVIASKNHNDQAGEFYLIIADGYTGVNATYAALHTEPDATDEIYFWLEPGGTSCTYTFDEGGKVSGAWFVEDNKAITLDVSGSFTVNGGLDDGYIITVGAGATLDFSAVGAGAAVEVEFQSNANASISTDSLGYFSLSGEYDNRVTLREEGVAYETAPTHGIDISGNISGTYSNFYHLNNIVDGVGENLSLTDCWYWFDVTNYGSDDPQEVPTSAAWSWVRSAIITYDEKRWYVKPTSTASLNSWTSFLHYCCPSIFATGAGATDIFVQFFEFPIECDLVYPTNVDPSGADYIGGEDFRPATHVTAYIVNMATDLEHGRDAAKYDHPLEHRLPIARLQDIMRSTAYNNNVRLCWNEGVFDGGKLEEQKSPQIQGTDMRYGYRDLKMVLRGDTVVGG